MKNQFNIEHAFPGICSRCFKEVAEFHGSDANGKPRITAFLATYRPVQIELDDGTLMTITLCDKCAESLDAKDYKKIMNSEIDGWEWELKNTLKGWNEQQKKEYRKNYFKKFIKEHIRPKGNRK